MKVIVVGINHAGTSAIRTLMTQNPKLKVTAYDQNTNISFLGCGIALTVGGVVKKLESLFYADSAQLSDMGAEIHMEHQVQAIDADKHEVTVKNLQTDETFTDTYDKLIYAAGSWPLDVPIKNKELENVNICKLYQHAQILIDKANDPSIRKVTVIGAGYIGIELAEAFHQKGKEVVLIDCIERVVPKYFDVEFTNRLQADMVDAGINLVLGSMVTEYIDDGTGKVCGVKTTKGDYDTDMVIQCIGFKPNTELLPNASKVRNGALIVNEKMETSLPDIYAIGDTVAIYNAAMQEHMNMALATNAVKTGVVAASQINGASSVVIPNVVGTNAICVFGNKLASTGLSEEAAKNCGLDVSSTYFHDNDRPEFMEEYEQVGIKLVYEKENLRLVGAQIGSYGDQSHTECIYYLALAIQKGMTLTEIAMTDVYFLPHFNKPFNFVISAILKAIGLDYV